MTESDNQLQELRQLLGELTARVYRIEQALKLEVRPAAEAASPKAPPPPPTPPLAARPEPLPYIPARTAPASPPAPETDLETRIGSHWLNRIGIAAVLVGVSYFLKFAFDNNWIGPAGRVTIGLLAGIAVVIWSERFRTRGYRIFSYSLKAVGVGVLYLSLWAAFQVYNLVPGGVAFVAMLAVTSATAVMAWTQDAEILAAFALTGGVSTPLLLSAGQNREVALFSYVTLLDLATLALVTLKPWRRLLVLSYAGTLVLFVGWYSAFYDRSQLGLTLGFATLFFSIFAVAPLMAREPDPGTVLSIPVPFFVAFLNAGVYFLQIYTMYEEINRKETAWFALALAAVYIFLSRQTRAGMARPLTLKFLHLALAVGFITIAIPIRLDAHWITMGWFVEAAVLLWVADRIHSDFLNVFAISTLALGVGRLLAIDNFYTTTLIFNTRMATYAVAIVVLGLVAWYGGRRGDETAGMVAAVAVVALNALALIALSREVSDYYARQMSNIRSQTGPWNPANWATFRNVQIVRDFTYSALWMGYGAMLMVVGFWRRSAFVRWQALLLIAFTTLKVFLYDVSELDRAYRIVSFIVLGALLLAISFVYQRDWLQLFARRKSEEGSAGA